MGLNDNNTYKNDFKPGTNCNSDGDDNNFIYVSQSNKFDKDVWNYNTKQISLYIDNLKTFLSKGLSYDLTDAIFTSTTSISNPTINNPTINNPTISNPIISEDVLKIGNNTELYIYRKGPAFRSKDKGVYIENVDAWREVTAEKCNACSIFHDGTILCSEVFLTHLGFKHNWTSGQSYSLTSAGYAGLNAGVGWSGAITVMGAYGTGRFRAGYILADIDLVAGGSVHTPTVIYDSDKKLKSNIVALSTDESLKLITSLEPKSYSFKKDKDQKIRYGFIAQEVEKVLQNNNLKNTGLVNYKLIKTDEDVTTNKDKYKDEEMNLSLSYTDFIAPTIAVVQYQQKEIENLKKEINELKQIISNK